MFKTKSPIMQSKVHFHVDKYRNLKKKFNFKLKEQIQTSVKKI